MQAPNKSPTKNVLQLIQDNKPFTPISNLFDL